MAKGQTRRACWHGHTLYRILQTYNLSNLRKGSEALDNSIKRNIYTGPLFKKYTLNSSRHAEKHIYAPRATLLCAKEDMPNAVGMK
jgi:hypothetical protein